MFSYFDYMCVSVQAVGIRLHYIIRLRIVTAFYYGWLKFCFVLKVISEKDNENCVKTNILEM
jgi:hypothetical protein